MEQINNNENGGYYFSPPKPERKIFTPDKADYAAAVSALVSAALTVFLGVWGGFNLGWAAAYAVFFITLSVYLIRTALLKSETRGVSPFGAVCGILSLALCLNFVLCADTLIHFLSFIVMLALGSVYFSCLSGRKIPGGDLGLLKFTVFAPFALERFKKVRFCAAVAFSQPYLISRESVCTGRRDGAAYRHRTGKLVLAVNVSGNSHILTLLLCLRLRERA